MRNTLKVPKSPGCAKVSVANHVSIGNELKKWRQMRQTKTKSSVSPQVPTDSTLVMLISKYTFYGMLRQCARSLDRLEVIIA